MNPLRILISFAISGMLLGSVACDQAKATSKADEAAAAKAAKATELLNTPRKPIGPNPAVVYAVPIAGAPVRGPDHAKVTMVEVSTFTCPHCLQVQSTIDQLMKKYGADLRIVHKHFLMEPERGMTPATASCAAHLQGRFVEMKSLIWDKAFKANDFSRERMVSLAKELGLDLKKFEADMDDACVQIVKADDAQLEKLQNPGTPSFFINGRVVVGAQPLQAFEKVIDEELEKATKRLSEGGSIADYYDTWVLAKGATSL